MRLFNNDLEATFIERPNRFIIYVDIEGETVKCHCPNTGRMGELLIPGVKVILERSNNPNRKTKFSVVAVYKGDLIVPITSVRANDVVSEIIIPRLFSEPKVRKEVTFADSRFDFLVEDGYANTFIEVKSCTLFIGDRAIFPDAPTSRGVKHLKELLEATKKGYRAMVILVIFNPESTSFSPNLKTDPLFFNTLKDVSNSIDIIPFKVGVDSKGIVSVASSEPIIPVVYT